MKRDIGLLTEKEFDIVIIGGGIYGAAIAWDGVLRGLSVALIEKGDFGSATSSNSLKIVHGGLRYLQHLDFKRMRESIRERRVLMHIAPHLVHPLPCVMPTYGHMAKGKEVMFIGLLMNDIISLDRNRIEDPTKHIPMGKIISKGECLRLIPGIDFRRVNGGLLWTDGQLYNSERFLLSFILSASEKGAVVANYVQADRLIVKKGRVRAVRATDVLTGDSVEIRGRLFINASGAWIDEVLSGVKSTECRINLSTAMNIVIKKQLLPGCAAGIYSKYYHERDDGSIYEGRRILFMTPWRRYTIIGTYHLPYHGRPSEMKVTEYEIEDFIKQINSGYPGSPITMDDVCFFYKGFLPMDGFDPNKGEVRLTHHYLIYDHQRRDGLDGLITVVGVKLTTARDVAEKTLNLALKILGKQRPCETHRVRLIGGGIKRFDEFVEGVRNNIDFSLKEDVKVHLAYNYGTEYKKVLKYMMENDKLKESVSENTNVTGAEIIHAVREEMACKLSDVVLRRTELGSGENPGKDVLKRCALLMGGELGWGRRRIKDEIEETEKIYELFKEQ